MATKLEIETRNKVLEFCRKKKISIKSIRHIYPRCYVVGITSTVSLIIARPWQDAEFHLKGTPMAGGARVVHRFEKGLKVGDWCATAYIVTDNTQEVIAVKMDK